MDAAAMPEDLLEGNFLGVRDLRKESVERVGELQFSFLDELQDHRGSEHFCDRTDPESVRRGQRFLFSSIDLAIADSAGVKNFAVFGDGQATHSLILFGE